MPKLRRVAFCAALFGSSATMACGPSASARVRLVAPNRAPIAVPVRLHVGDALQPSGFFPLAIVIGTGGGDEDELLEVMTARAREVGCTELFVVPPHGFPFARQRSTGVCGVVDEAAR